MRYLARWDKAYFARERERERLGIGGRRTRASPCVRDTLPQLIYGLATNCSVCTIVSILRRYKRYKNRPGQIYRFIEYTTEAAVQLRGIV